MKRQVVIFMILASVVLVINGCAKREPEGQISADSSELEPIEIVLQANGNHVECVLGEGNMQLRINADVTIPNEIKIGSVETGYPDVSKIEDTLCTEKMEEIDDGAWAIKSDGENYEYEQFYQQTDDFANYYNAKLKGNFENESTADTKVLSDQADEILSACSYPAELLYTEGNGDMLACFYSPTVHGIPVVSKSAGLGGTQLYITENGLGEMLLEKAVLESTLKDTEVLTLDAALNMMESQCEAGRIPLLSENDEIRYIRLAYYIDEQSNLLPVWCFSIDFPNEGQEYVAYCIDAKMGELVFDYNSYSVIGEGED